MKITQVERQKKNQKRFNIYLDGKFAFGADEDAVVDHRLVVGKEISEEDLERILFATDVGKLMERMYGLFSVRMRTEREVKNYFRVKNLEYRIKDKEEVSDIIVEAVIKKLKEKELLDDERFAREWIHARRVSKNKGINAIKAELFQKGVDRHIVEEAIESFASPSPVPSPQGEGIAFTIEEVPSEEDLAMKALEKKIKDLELLSDPKEKQRMLGFLIRKGFSYEVSIGAIESFLKKE